MKSTRSSASAGPGARRTSALEWAKQPEVASGVLHELSQRRRRRSRRRARIAAAAGAAALAVAAYFFPGPTVSTGDAVPNATTTARLSIPERRVLPDGSVVELKEGAVIEVAFVESTRRIVLWKGEAHFEVAKNPHRPFVVTVGAMEVRAVGTAFSVGVDRSSVQVLVTHGEVAIETPAAAHFPGEAASAPPARLLASLTAGNRVVLDLGEAAAAAPSVEIVSAAESSERLAWRVPRLDFSATPLAEALPIFNRHSKVKVSLADRSLEGLQISGIIRADNVEPLLWLLETNYRVVAERRDDGVVLHAAK